jgi:hypothetical protein
MTKWHKIDDPDNPPPKDGTKVDMWVASKYGVFRVPDCSWRGYRTSSFEHCWRVYTQDPEAMHDMEWLPFANNYYESDITHWSMSEPPND